MTTNEKCVIISPMSLEEELKVLWKEKQELEKEDTEDSFVPAKQTTMNKDEALVYFEL